MQIFCIECADEVEARLTNGEEIYPHREDLYSLPFWKCDCCDNYVGCHHKTDKPTQPLGVIPNQEMKAIRQKLHRLMDPIWKQGHMSRTKLYKHISDKLGYTFHNGSLRNLTEANDALEVVNLLRMDLYVK